jgi:hypothetical protein
MIIKPDKAITMSNNALNRLIANAERVLADYDDANKAWKADRVSGRKHTAFMLDWYE